MITQQRLEAARKYQSKPSIQFEVFPEVTKANLSPGQVPSANSLSFWFGAESAFADAQSMSIIGSMAYERHNFVGQSQWLAESIAEKWNQLVQFES
jgi:hypothetical protein